MPASLTQLQRIPAERKLELNKLPLAELADIVTHLREQEASQRAAANAAHEQWRNASAAVEKTQDDIAYLKWRLDQEL